MKNLTVNEVLTLWLFSKVGTPKRVRPTEGNTSSRFSSQATMIVCANRVEGIPGFCEPILRAWLDVKGISEDEAFYALMDYLKALEQSLEASPIKPVEANEIVTEISSFTLREIADALGLKYTNQAKRWMDDYAHTVPGVFQFEKHWKIMNMETLKHAFKEISKKIA